MPNRTPSKFEEYLESVSDLPVGRIAGELYGTLCEADYSRHLTVPAAQNAVTPFPNYKNIMKQVPTENSTSQPDVQKPYEYEPCGGRCTRNSLEDTNEAFKETYKPKTYKLGGESKVKNLIQRAKDHLPNPVEMSVASLRSEPVSGFSTKATFAGPGAATINGVDAGYGGNGGGGGGGTPTVTT